MAYLSEDNSECLSFCDRPCLECVFPSGGTQQCSKCAVGYELVNKECVADVGCNSNQECEGCPI